MYLRHTLQYFALSAALLFPAAIHAQEAAGATSNPPAQTSGQLTPNEAALLERIRQLELRIDALEHQQAGAKGAPAMPAPTPSPAPTVNPVTAAAPASSSNAAAPITAAVQVPPEVVPVPSHPAVKVYGRVELDTIYSSRETNPLDPRQFNGYSTAAGPISNSSSTFNPRFSVIGLEASAHHGSQALDAKVETDFYSTDSANDITPRLRLAYVAYTYKNTEATFGMDWLAVAPLLPDLLDFSIMGYTGNLWQRIPQLTVRQKLGTHWEVLGTAFRDERGFTLQPAPYENSPFTDPVKTPFVGVRGAFENWGINKGGLVAFSGAYRQFTYPSTKRNVASDLLAVELVVPIASKLKWSSKVAHGQGLGDEFFRFNQELNGDIPIKTTVGWTELAYAPMKKLFFASGYGLDNPLGKDLIGISNNDANYHRNARVFADSVYTLYGGISVGLELNYLHTNWTDGSRFTAYQPMASFFYTF